MTTPEDWELDFQNPPVIPPPGYQYPLDLGIPIDVQPVLPCDHCKTPGPHTLGQTLHTGGGNAIDLLFCNQKCREDFYLSRLRSFGL